MDVSDEVQKYFVSKFTTGKGTKFNVFFSEVMFMLLTVSKRSLS